MTGSRCRAVRKPRGGELNAAIAQGVVRRHTHVTGHGPSRARAFFRGNVVVVILENAMTSAERSLVADGKAATVLDVRRQVHRGMRTELVGVVERLTDSRVRAFMSDDHVDPDLGSLVFLLDRAVPP